MYVGSLCFCHKDNQRKNNIWSVPLSAYEIATFLKKRLSVCYKKKSDIIWEGEIEAISPTKIKEGFLNMIKKSYDLFTINHFVYICISRMLQKEKTYSTFLFKCSGTLNVQVTSCVTFFLISTLIYK